MLHRLLASFLLLGTLIPLRAADDKPAPDLPRAELDAKIDKLLRDIINTGRTVNNDGDPAGCYRLFQGSLMTLAPLLDHRPQLKQDIEKGLKHAETLTDSSDKAFALRDVIDFVRSTLRKDKPASPPEKK